jgi:hypothetical protein
MKQVKFIGSVAFCKANFNKSMRKAGKAGSGAINVSARMVFFEAGMITPSWPGLTSAYKGILNG